jgi:hypothetical protein
VGIAVAVSRADARVAVRPKRARDLKLTMLLMMMMMMMMMRDDNDKL